MRFGKFDWFVRYNCFPLVCRSRDYRVVAKGQPTENYYYFRYIGRLEIYWNDCHRVCILYSYHILPRATRLIFANRAMFGDNKKLSINSSLNNIANNAIIYSSYMFFAAGAPIQLDFVSVTGNLFYPWLRYWYTR